MKFSKIKVIILALVSMLVFAGVAEAKKIDLKRARAVALRTATADCKFDARTALALKKEFTKCADAHVAKENGCSFGPPIVRIDKAQCDADYLIHSRLDPKRYRMCFYDPKIRVLQRKSGSYYVPNAFRHRNCIILKTGAPDGARTATLSAAEYLHLDETQKSLQGIPTIWNASPDDDISAYQAELRRQGHTISTTWKFNGYNRVSSTYICQRILMWAKWTSSSSYSWVGAEFRSYRAADGKKINDAVGCGPDV